MNRRVRFEQRVLGGATAETWHFVDEIPESVEMPTVGELAGPTHSKAAWRRVIAIEKAPAAWDVSSVVKLEDIDCSRLKFDFEQEIAVLRDAGWKR